MSGYSIHWGLRTVAENSPISARLKYNIPNEDWGLWSCAKPSKIWIMASGTFSLVRYMVGWGHQEKYYFKIHLVPMCRQPETRMEFVNSRWCGNLFGIERPSLISILNQIVPLRPCRTTNCVLSQQLCFSITRASHYNYGAPGDYGDQITQRSFPSSCKPKPRFRLTDLHKLTTFIWVCVVQEIPLCSYLRQLYPT